MDLLRVAARVASAHAVVSADMAEPDWLLVEESLIGAFAGVDTSAAGAIDLAGPWAEHGLGVRLDVADDSLSVTVVGPDGTEDPIWEGPLSDWNEESQGEAAHESLAAMGGFLGD